MRFGTSCCLDADNDKICDADKPTTTTCQSPYILVGKDCCLDANSNSICDRDEETTVQEAQPQQEVSPIESKATIGDLRDAVVTVQTAAQNKREDYGTFTGFVVSGKHILTSYYAIENYVTCENYCNISVYFANKDVYTADVISYDKEWGFALLELLTDNSNFLSIPISTEESEVGDPIYILTATKELPFSVKKGIISQKNRPPLSQSKERKYQKYLQLDTPTSPEGMGGPIVSESGKAFGMLVYYLDRAESLTFGLQSEILNTLYKDSYPRFLEIKQASSSFKIHGAKPVQFRNRGTTATNDNTLTKVSLELPNSKDHSQQYCFSSATITHRGFYADKRKDYEGVLVEPQETKSIEYKPDLKLSLNEKHFYVIDVIDCKTNEVYGTFYGPVN